VKKAEFFYAYASEDTVVQLWSTGSFDSRERAPLSEDFATVFGIPDDNAYVAEPAVQFAIENRESGEDQPLPSIFSSP
jgi:hypothetical protein